MVAWREKFPFEFVLMLGDNIYGPHTPADYASKFEEPYRPLLEAGVKFYAAIGNHDDPGSIYYGPFNMGGQRYYTFRRTEQSLSGITGGSVRFEGVDLTALPTSEFHPYRRRMQIVMQDPGAALDPRMTVRDSIAEGMDAFGVGAGPDERTARVADLMRELPNKVRISVVGASSYPGRSTASQGVRLGGMVEGAAADLSGKHVLIVDDILDSGRTIRAIRDEISRRSPKSVRACVLLRKTVASALATPCEYVGFDIPDARDAVIRLPGDNAPRTGVACVFKPNQRALALTFRRGETARFEGRFAEYDGILHQVWLDGCKLARRR